MSAQIIAAKTRAEIALVRALFEDYAASLRIDLCFQGFATELAELPGAYASPHGRLLLATVESAPAGCVALRPRNEHTCEIKRLFVRPEHQGHGLGRKLVERAIADARAIGYANVLLDTLPEMSRAVQLYEALGFVRCAPYFDSPIAGNIFMELRFDRS